MYSSVKAKLEPTLILRDPDTDGSKQRIQTRNKKTKDETLEREREYRLMGRKKFRHHNLIRRDSAVFTSGNSLVGQSTLAPKLLH